MSDFVIITGLEVKPVKTLQPTSAISLRGLIKYSSSLSLFHHLLQPFPIQEHDTLLNVVIFGISLCCVQCFLGNDHDLYSIKINKMFY